MIDKRAMSIAFPTVLAFATAGYYISKPGYFKGVGLIIGAIAGFQLSDVILKNIENHKNRSNAINLQKLALAASPVGDSKKTHEIQVKPKKSI